jgi:DNA-binding XRE family transcriptional regulator
MENKIREICEAKKIPISRLAKKASVSRQHLYEIINNKSDPTGPVMFKIANALGEQVTDIFFDRIGNYVEQCATKESPIKESA